MSKHITIEGKYRNGRLNTIGCHNPTKGEFTPEHRQHLIHMIDTYLKPNKDKFKSIRVIFTYNGIEFSSISSVDNLLDADTFVLAQRLINIYEHRLEMLRE